MCIIVPRKKKRELGNLVRMKILTFGGKFGSLKQGNIRKVGKLWRKFWVGHWIMMHLFPTMLVILIRNQKKWFILVYNKLCKLHIKWLTLVWMFRLSLQICFCSSWFNPWYGFVVFQLKWILIKIAIEVCKYSSFAWIVQSMVQSVVLQAESHFHHVENKGLTVASTSQASTVL